MSHLTPLSYRESAICRAACPDCINAQAKIEQLQAKPRAFTAQALPSIEGTTMTCPACEKNFLYAAGKPENTICIQGKRVRRWFRQCKIPGAHIHQKCPSCSARWVRRMPAKTAQEHFE